MRILIYFLLIFAGGITVGAMFPFGEQPAVVTETAVEHAVKHLEPTYVCPMHAEITGTEPASCPICGMDLELRESAASGQTSEAAVTVSSAMINSLGIHVVHVDRGPVAEEIYASGYVERVSEPRLLEFNSHVAGKILQTHVHTGQWVVENDPVITIDYSPYQEILQGYLHALNKDDLRTALKLRQKLVDMGVSDDVVEGMDEEFAFPENLQIVAPFPGQITWITGAEAIASGQPLFHLEAPTLAEVELRCHSRLARGVQVGHTGRLEVSHLPGQAWPGRVAEVYHNRAGFYSTFSFLVEVPAGALEFGVFAGAFVNAGTAEDVVRVPANAVIYDEDATRIVVLRDKNEFEVVDLDLGFQGNEWVEVLSGVDVGDHVVLRGQYLIDSEATLQAGLRRLQD